MTEKQIKQSVAEDDTTTLTATLRALTDHTTTSLGDTLFNLDAGRAVVVSSDRSAAKWAPRWLRQAGFDTQVIADAGQAMEILQKDPPDVVFVEAAGRGATSASLLEEIRASDKLDPLLFALCGTAQEINAAIDSGVHDVQRKPFDWQILGRRAKSLLQQRRRQQELVDTRETLKTALDAANRARRQLRRSEMFVAETGLPNRTKFVDLIAKGMRAAERDGNRLGVAVIGFSRFYVILEALGRKELDTIFGEIGERLNDCAVTAIDTNPRLTGLRTAAIGHVGSSHFAIMMTCSKKMQELKVLCDEIQELQGTPVAAGGQTVFLSTSTGVAVYPKDSDDAESLLIKAETAMREARKTGAATKFFHASNEAAAVRKLRIEQMLYSAIDNRELKLAYQPICDMLTDRVVAVEALLRWPQSGGNMIEPGEFVPIAEDAGLMHRVGEFVIAEACQQLQAWRKEGLDDLRVAINLARCQLMDDRLPEMIRHYLEINRVSPALVELEISERGALTGNKEAVNKLANLKAMGLTVSVDDFGTGDSSIAYLKDMPIDTLKIDRSYIARIATDERENRMIAAIVALAQRLELTVIAEGVETDAQIRILQSLGCDLYQGFLRAPALPVAELVQLVRATSVQ